MDSQRGQTSHSVDDHFIDHAMNIAETLVNLAYLICVESDNNRSLVRAYANQAEERLQVLGRLIRSIE